MKKLAILAAIVLGLYVAFAQTVLSQDAALPEGATDSGSVTEGSSGGEGVETLQGGSGQDVFEDRQPGTDIIRQEPEPNMPEGSTAGESPEEGEGGGGGD